jgi:hypothetical protein
MENLRPGGTGGRILSRSVRKNWISNSISSVGFTAMPYAANLDGVGVWADEEEAVVAYAQTKFVSALHSFHVTQARLCKTVKSGEDMHRHMLAQAADITFGRIGPNNPLHFGSR